MGTFLPGYIIESSKWNRPGTAAQCLRCVTRLHKELSVPCTVFLRGIALEEYADEVLKARDELGDLVDLEQATYSGLPLKTVCQHDHQGVKVFEGGSFRECRIDLSRASEVFERALGKRPEGVACSLGCYRGLADRADLLGALKELGISFCRTYTRNSRDWSPLAFETQPYNYAAQGFAEIAEIPGQGWPECALKEALGFANGEGYVRQICKDLDYVAEKNLTWSHAGYDWSLSRTDPELAGMRKILEYALKRNFKMQTHLGYCRENFSSQKQGE